MTAQRNVPLDLELPGGSGGVERVPVRTGHLLSERPRELNGSPARSGEVITAAALAAFVTDTGDPQPLTRVPGVSVGCAEEEATSTGVTVVRFDRLSPTVVDVRGPASATYHTHSLGLEATFGRRDAVFLSGGSVYGLDAAPRGPHLPPRPGPRGGGVRRLAPVPADRRERPCTTSPRRRAARRLSAARFRGDRAGQACAGAHRSLRRPGRPDREVRGAGSVDGGRAGLGRRPARPRPLDRAPDRVQLRRGDPRPRLGSVDRWGPPSLRTDPAPGPEAGPPRFAGTTLAVVATNAALNGPRC